MRVLIAMAIMVMTGSLMAGGATAATPPTAPQPPPRFEAAFIGGFWFGTPASIDRVDVTGVKFGLPICSGPGTVKGFEWALFCGATDHIYGFQWGMAGASISKDMHGFQMALVNSAANDLKGMQMGIVNLGDRKGFQLGIVNYADNVDCQFGLVNFNKNGWMPFMVGFNRSK